MEQKIGHGDKRARLVGSVQDGIAEVLFTMASVLYSVDAQQDTLLYLRMSLLLRSDFPLAQLLLGGVLEEDGHYAEAAEVYAGVDDEGPLAERALLRRAYMIERQGRLEEALVMLDSRAEANPESYDAYVAKGDLLRMRAMYKEAADAYSQALSRISNLEPRHWGIFFARGACYERTDDWIKAEGDLRKALLLNPDHAEVLNYLGYGLLARGENLDEAKELIEQAYALQPNAPHIMDSMGWVLFKSGDLEGALAQLEQAIELMPSDPTVNEHLGDVYWYAGRKTEARYQWERTLTFSPEPEAERAIRLKLREGLPPLADKAKPQSMNAHHAAEIDIPEIAN
jgi:Flp pilus assembly protein TadD